MAKKLMKQHHLDMMRFTEKYDVDSEIVERNVYDRSFFKEPLWLMNLIKIVNNLCNCSCVLREEPKCENGYIHMHVVFVASKDDIDRVYEMFNFFKKTVYDLSNTHVKLVHGNTTHWRSFAEGFTTRLLERSRIFQVKKPEPKFEDVDDDVSWTDDDERESEEDEYYKDVEDVSDWDESAEVDDTISEETSIQLYEYMSKMKKKIDDYIANMDNLHDKQVQTKSKVLLSSYNMGRQQAETTNLRFVDKKHQLIDKTQKEKQKNG